MNASRLAVLKVGFVSAVGLDAPSSCAAIRAKLANPTETRFVDASGDYVVAHQVILEQPWRGRTKLVKMVVQAIDECLEGVARGEWPRIPLLLCVAERERPGRIEGLEESFFGEIQRELRATFAEESSIIPSGRVGIAKALSLAENLVATDRFPLVLIAAADSLIVSSTLATYDRDGRLLTNSNSNGFVPGEGAAALLVGINTVTRERLLVCGLGFALESATIAGEEPMRGLGLSAAVSQSLEAARCNLGDLSFRVTDLSGEQYYFKEAALALSRLLRTRKAEFDLWHPAESIGETGAVAGLASVIVSEAACRKGYAPGAGILCHGGNDDGRRIAAVLRYERD